MGFMTNLVALLTVLELAKFGHEESGNFDSEDYNEEEQAIERIEQIVNYIMQNQEHTIIWSEKTP